MSWAWQPDPVRREFSSLARMKAQLVINLTDEAGECSHGALPLDRNKPAGCRCWTPDVIAALANRQQENPDFSDAA